MIIINITSPHYKPKTPNNRTNIIYYGQIFNIDL